MSLLGQVIATATIIGVTVVMFALAIALGSQEVAWVALGGAFVSHAAWGETRQRWLSATSKRRDAELYSI